MTASPAIATTPRQLRLDLRIEQMAPLLQMAAVKAALQLDEDDILSLIDTGALRYAFDLARQGASRKFPAVWRGSAAAYHHKESDEAALDAVLADILPPTRPLIRLVDLRGKLGWSVQGHVRGLVEDGLLKVDASHARPRRGPTASPLITRASAVAFLTARRML